MSVCDGQDLASFPAEQDGFRHDRHYLDHKHDRQHQVLISSSFIENGFEHKQKTSLAFPDLCCL